MVYHQLNLIQIISEEFLEPILEDLDMKTPTAKAAKISLKLVKKYHTMAIKNFSVSIN